MDDVPVVEDEGFSSQAKTISKDMAGYHEEPEQEMLFQVKDFDEEQKRAFTLDVKGAQIHPGSNEKMMRHTFHDKGPEEMGKLADTSQQQSEKSPSEPGVASHQPQSFKRDKSRRSTFKQETLKQVAEDETKQPIVLMDAETNKVAQETATPMRAALKLDVDQDLQLETNSNQRLTEQLRHIASSGGRENSLGNDGTPSHKSSGFNEEENALIGGKQADNKHGSHDGVGKHFELYQHLGNSRMGTGTIRTTRAVKASIAAKHKAL